MDDQDTLRSAVAHLRHGSGGSDPWTECGPSHRVGGFAWRDRHGNQFDVTISLFRTASRSPEEREAERLRDGWQTIMLGDDSASITDGEAWRRALAYRSSSS